MTCKIDQIGKGNIFTWSNAKEYIPIHSREVLVQLKDGSLAIAKYDHIDNAWYLIDLVHNNNLIKSVYRWADMIYFQSMPRDTSPMSFNEIKFKTHKCCCRSCQPESCKDVT